MTEQEVRRRRVFYVPGYDPMPPRRYRELYRCEGALQARLGKYTLRMLRGPGPRCGWTVETRIDGNVTLARIDVLTWSDIVRDSMGCGVASTYAQLCRTVWIYVTSGAFFRLVRLRKGPVIAALYPVVMLLVQLAVAGAAGVAAGALAPAVLALPAGVGLGALVLGWFRRIDGRIFAYYLMHDFSFSARGGGAYSLQLEARLAAFRDQIAAALDEDVDEVLVVGHSSGAHLAVSVLADLVRGGCLPARGPALGLLTLGQVIPMVSFLPEAHRLRADLNLLAGTDTLFWVDVTAPGDGCAFSLCDPAAVSGVRPAMATGPLVLSAAYSRTLTAESLARIRWHFLRLHFQYLCAFDNLSGGPAEYDYFRVTAGPLTLASHFAGRSPSRSRIDRPASPYWSIAP